MKKEIIGTIVSVLLFISILSATDISKSDQEIYGVWIEPEYRLQLFKSVNRDAVSMLMEPYNPPIKIPLSGGNFAYTITVINNEVTPEVFDVWTVAILPNGYPYGPVYGPADFQLPGEWTATSDLTQHVPGFAPPGIYTYISHVGIYPGEVWDSDSFTFEKLSVGGWFAQSPGVDYWLRAIDFLDLNNGWAVGSAWEILRTTDGGDTWYPVDYQQPYPHNYHDVSFVDPQKGWVVGSKILHTTNAGGNWIEQYSYYEYPLYGVIFIDDNTGWAVGGYTDIFGSNDKRVIEHTTDGGDTWYGQFIDYYEDPLSGVNSTDAFNGLTVGPAGTILHTSNSGNDWVAQTSGTYQSLNSVFFIDPNTGWCVGEGGTVLNTTNGGDNWYAQNPGTTDDYEGVHFIDANTGWIVGVNYYPYHAVILHTTDGGDTWYAQDPGTGTDDVNLFDVEFIDANHGWVSGSLWPAIGVMLHTETGGE